MRRQHAFPLLLALVVVLALVALRQTPVHPDSFSGVERIVAVGDVHGGYDEFTGILRAAGVIDGANRWSGGRTHFVQTGDLLDRGAGSRKVMDLVMRLERQAVASGGRVHALIGNHEAMNLTGDLRYVSAAEYAAFATPHSAAVRDRAYGTLADPARREDPEYRQAWEQAHPLGWVEHRQAFGPDARYGRWIRRHNAIVKINDYLFLHGGIGPAVAPSSVREINERLRAEVRRPDVPKDGLAVGRTGPLWYRGLAQDAEADLAPRVDQLLALHGVSHIVIGHTTMPGTVVPRLGGKVLLIDVGLSARYGAHPACLIVEQGRAFTLHRGRRLLLPLGDEDATLDYLRTAATLDPHPSPIDPLIAAGGRLPLPEEVAEQR